jgi:hypothetical protein
MLEFTHKIEPPTKEITSVGWISPNCIVTGLRDLIIIWHVEGTHVEKKKELKDVGSVYEIVTLPKFRLTHRNSDNAFPIWNLETGEQITLLQDDRQFYDGWLTDGGKTFVTATDRAHITYWDSENFEKIASFQVPCSGEGSSLWTLHKLAPHMLIVQQQDDLTFFNTSQNKIILTLVVRMIQSIAILHDGSLAIATENAQILCYNFGKWENLYRWVFLGRSDENSVFSQLLNDIIFYFVILTSNHICHINLPQDQQRIEPPQIDQEKGLL